MDKVEDLAKKIKEAKRQLNEKHNELSGLEAELAKKTLEEKEAQEKLREAKMFGIDVNQLHSVDIIAKDLGQSEHVMENLLKNEPDMFLSLIFHAWGKNRENYRKQLSAAGINGVDGLSIADDMRAIHKFFSAKANQDPTMNPDFYSEYMETRQRAITAIDKLFKYMEIEADRMNNETGFAGGLMQYIKSAVPDCKAFVDIPPPKEEKQDSVIVQDNAEEKEPLKIEQKKQEEVAKPEPPKKKEKGFIGSMVDKIEEFTGGVQEQ